MTEPAPTLIRDVNVVLDTPGRWQVHHQGIHLFTIEVDEAFNLWGLVGDKRSPMLKDLFATNTSQYSFLRVP